MLTLVCPQFPLWTHFTDNSNIHLYVCRIPQSAGNRSFTLVRNGVGNLGFLFRRARKLQAPACSRAAMAAVESVQCFGRKKTAVAVTYCKKGRGLIKINGCPIELVEPEILRYKALEPVLLLGRQKFAGVDMRIRVKGGGNTSQIYAIRQSIAKALVAYFQKYVDEQSKKEIKDVLLRYDRTLLVADPRRCEPKKFGGRGARSRFQKSYR